MSLNKIFLRYYPPGIALNYRYHNGEECLQHIDLLDLNINSNSSEVARNLLLANVDNEFHEERTSSFSDSTTRSGSCDKTPSVTSNVADNSAAYIPTLQGVLRKAIVKLQRKLQEPTKKKFYLHRRLDTHILPLTNVAFDRNGERCLTGSYDRTCRIINTHTGNVEHVLSEHDNVVFSVAFNFPKCLEHIPLDQAAFSLKRRKETKSFPSQFSVYQMSLNKIFLRYYPPGIALNYRYHNGEECLQHIDLLDLNINSNSSEVARNLLLANVDNEFHEERTSSFSDSTTRSGSCDKTPSVTSNVADNSAAYIPTLQGVLRKAIVKLQRKLQEPTKKKFYLHRRLDTHILPLTNVAFDRNGERCLTGSYDRTCRIINTHTGNVEHVLSEHDNVVFSVAFNFPKCDRVATGSFDSTVKIWCPSSGLCRTTLMGHTAEVVCAEFQPVNNETICTASMDGTARLFHIESTQEMQTLGHHGAEVINCRFSRDGNLLLTGSFDRTAAIWDVRTKSAVSHLRNHTAELSNSIWNFSCDLVATGSLDGTACIWDVRMTNNPLHVIRDHTDEILDVAFDSTGKRLATGSNDCTARIWNLSGNLELQSVMVGHSEEVSKVCFSPPGGLLLTASGDHTARLWLTESGLCSQVLAGHDADVFSCAFSYTGDVVLTASKDNSCRLWR